MARATQPARTRAPAVAPRTLSPARVTVVNAAAAELGRNCRTGSRLAGSRAPARVGSTMTPAIRTPMLLAALRSRIPRARPISAIAVM